MPALPHRQGRGLRVTVGFSDGPFCGGLGVPRLQWDSEARLRLDVT